MLLHLAGIALTFCCGSENLCMWELENDWGLGRLAGAHAMPVGDGLDFAINAIDAAAKTAMVALRPAPSIPAYSSMSMPGGGSSTQIYGAIPASLAAGLVGATQMAISLFRIWVVS